DALELLGRLLVLVQRVEEGFRDEDRVVPEVALLAGGLVTLRAQHLVDGDLNVGRGRGVNREVRRDGLRGVPSVSSRLGERLGGRVEALLLLLAVFERSSRK